MLFSLLLIFLIYIPFQVAINPTNGIDLASLRIFSIILALLWLISSLKNKKLLLPFKIQTFFIFAFLGISILSFVYSWNIQWSLRKLLFWLSFFPLYLIVYSLVDNFSRYKKVTSCLVWGAGLSALTGIIQFTLQFSLGLEKSLKIWGDLSTVFLGNAFGKAVSENSSWLVGISGKDYFRAVSFFPDPHMFSFYLGLSLPWAMALFLSSSKKISRFIFLAFFLLILAADVLTFSRGGYLGLLAGLVLVLIILAKKLAPAPKYSMHKSRTSCPKMKDESVEYPEHNFLVRGFTLKTKLIAFFILIVLFGLIFTFFAPARQRFLSSLNFFEGSNIERISIWKQSYEIISNNWFLGVGLGNYSLAIKPSANYREPIYSHNLYMDLAAETGILNSLVWIGIIVASFLGYWKKSKNNNFYLAGMISLTIFSFHALVESPLFSVQVLPLIIIIISLSLTKENEQPQN
jgi:O-antigen ligase